MTYRNYKTVLKLFPYIWPRDWKIRGRVFLAMFLLIASMGLNVGVPLILKHVINVISSPSHTVYLAEALLISYGVAWTISKMMEQIRLISIARIIERGMRLLCINVFNHLINLSARFHSDRKTGVLLGAIDRAQYSFWPFFAGLFFLILPTLIEIVIAAIILTYLYGFFYGFILSMTLIIYMIFSIYGSHWSTKTQCIANEASGLVTNNLVDSLLNYETIKHFSNQEYESKKCNALLIKREDASTKQQVQAQVVQLIQGFIIGLGLIILTWKSGNQVISGTFHISDFVLINVYLLQFISPLGNFGYVLRDINEGLTNIDEVMNILNEKPDIQDSPAAKRLNTTHCDIRFEKVSFSYDKRRPILNEISFDIPAQKTIAIVGPTGSGKSTIAKLLFRYFDISSGKICVGNQDIRDITQDSLQKHVGIVPQHASLFNDTLRYNISYGKPNASEEEIQKAIVNSHLNFFISSLPDGLNTVVGEHGLKLSGGERQRVAIARVLLKNPEIYIFDEATSSLDTETENVIQKNIEEISANKTSLIIAHRLSTVIHADKIIVLEHGKIVESGKHHDLLKNNALYSKLWAQQTKD